MSSFSRSRPSEELVFEQEDFDIHVEQAIAKEFGRSKSRRGLGDRPGLIRMLAVVFGLLCGEAGNVDQPTVDTPDDSCSSAAVAANAKSPRRQG
jgi:hypothetical protein